jgi:hypothetical protein
VGLVPPEEQAEVLDEEPAAWGYYCEGAPILVANTIRSTRKLVNGTPGLMDSLFWEGGPPPEVAAAFARGGYSLIDVDVPPHAVNVRVSGGLWHGVPLDDLSDLVESVATDATVISLLVHKEHLEIDMYSIKSAQHGLPGKMEVSTHGYILAFALTAFKLQGRTLPRLLINLGTRPQAPYITMNAFYVMVSRVRAFEGLRWFDCDPSERRKLLSLRWSDNLEAWEAGFDEVGDWCPERAKTWLDSHTAELAVRRAKAEAERKAARPLKQPSHPELKERCKAAKVNDVGTRAMLIERKEREEADVRGNGARGNGGCAGRHSTEPAVGQGSGLGGGSSTGGCGNSGHARGTRDVGGGAATICLGWTQPLTQQPSWWTSGSSERRRRR